MLGARIRVLCCFSKHVPPLKDLQWSVPVFVGEGKGQGGLTMHVERNLRNGISRVRCIGALRRNFERGSWKLEDGYWDLAKSIVQGLSREDGRKERKR